LPVEAVPKFVPKAAQVLRWRPLLSIRVPKQPPMSSLDTQAEPDGRCLVQLLTQSRAWARRCPVVSLVIECLRDCSHEGKENRGKNALPSGWPRFWARRRSAWPRSQAAPDRLRWPPGGRCYH